MKAWLKKYWWVLILPLAVLWFLLKLIDRSLAVADDPLRKARDEADDLKDKTSQEISAIDATTQTGLKEIEEASKIKDKRRRLQKLADIGNRRSQ